MLRQAHFGLLLYSVAIVFSSPFSSGCSDSYRPETQVIPPGTGATGAVGTPTAGRPAGGRAGSAAPSPRAGSVAPVPRSGAGGGLSAGSGSPADVAFSARLDQSSVILDVKNPFAAYYVTCSDALILQKLDIAMGSWVDPTDQRPPSYNNPGYYLDGRFVPPSSDAGCDVRSCQNFGSTNFVAKAAEYVQVGVVEVIHQGVTIHVPSIETRPIAGSVRVVVQYALDPMCGGALQSAVLGLTIPTTEGVCCVVGIGGCNSAGPAGGWAIDYDSCRGFWPMPGTYFREAMDARGCPYLIEDFNQCCGCDDAGVEG